MTTDTVSQQPKEPKEERINIRSTEAERAVLAKLAQYHGISPTDVLHMLIAEAARKAGITK